MQLKRLCRGLLTLGISCSLMFQTPVLAAEETTTDTQTHINSYNIPFFDAIQAE